MFGVLYNDVDIPSKTHNSTSNLNIAHCPELTIKPMATSSKHLYSLADAKPLFQSDLGYLTQVTNDEISILKNLSIQKLVIAPGVIREP